MEINSSNYQKLAERTSATATPQGIQKAQLALDNYNIVRLLHAGMGLCTEAGEFQDVLKRHVFYGKPLGEEELENLMEEIGDVVWYCAEALNALAVTFDIALDRNIAKLAKRYGDKFSEFLALNRDLEAEQKVLEGSEITSDLINRAEKLGGRIVWDGYASRWLFEVTEDDPARRWAAKWKEFTHQRSNDGNTYEVWIPHWLPRWVNERETEQKVASSVTGEQAAEEHEWIPSRLPAECTPLVQASKRDSNYKVEQATSLADIQQQLIDARLKDEQMADWARMYGQRLIDKCMKLMQEKGDLEDERDDLIRQHENDYGEAGDI